MDILKHVFISLFLIGTTNAQNATATESGLTDISKAFISLAVLGGACLVAFIIAKVVDHCYDRAALRDDASDISEHTRKLIRARMTLNRFKAPIKNKKKAKKPGKKDSDKNTKLFFKLWSSNAKSKVNKRKKSDIVINVEEANFKDQLHVNGSPHQTHPHHHVTFIDEVDKRGSETEGVVLSLPVPTLPTTNGSATNHPSILHHQSDAKPISTISDKVQATDNGSAKNSARVASGSSNSTKDTKATPPPVRSGRSTPTNDRNPKSSGITGGSRATPPPPSGGGRTTPITDRNTKTMPISGGTAQPKSTKSQNGGSSKDHPPRSPSPTKATPNKINVTPNRPKTAPTQRPMSKSVASKPIIVKTSGQTKPIPVRSTSTKSLHTKNVSKKA